MADDETLPSDKLKAARYETLIRLLFMLLFGIIWNVGEVVLALVVFLQLLFVLVRGERNPRLLAFSDQLAAFLRQVARYLAFNSDDKPFPFADWPVGDGDDHGGRAPPA